MLTKNNKTLSGTRIDKHRGSVSMRKEEPSPE